MKPNQKRRCILWTTAYAEILTGGRVGGIGVQIMFWAKAFSLNGWEVFSLYQGKRPNDLDECVFLPDKETASWKFLLYFFMSLHILLKVKPDVVICRGGKNRNLLFIAFWCRLLRIKVIQFLASDVDLRHKELQLSIVDRFNINLFRLGLRLTKYIVVQNEYQRELVNAQFRNKRILQIPNIWGDIDNIEQGELAYRNYILWVGNTRALKRPLWVFEIAKHYPHLKFVMVGSNADNDTYQKCCELAKEINNVDFLGGKPFFKTNTYFSNATLLLCTSEYEGFPNTFLQAWSNNIPVISTVDPSGLIKKHKLGEVCVSVAEFVAAIDKILTNQNTYTDIVDSIREYFYKAHSLSNNYTRLIKFIQL